MGPDASAYSVLGLKPGADLAAVDAAYRALIKRYHPDREGGDLARAAEINWAYDHIRQQRRLPARRRTSFPVVQPELRQKRTGRGPWLGAALAVAVAAALIGFPAADTPDSGFGGAIGSPIFQPPTSLAHSDQVARLQFVDEPLDSDAIDRSVMSAIRLAGAGETSRLASQSRRCHAELRRDPDLSRFDQCVAFDEAAVVLMGRNRLHEDGQFSSAAVTGRHLGAARIFSEDYLMIESRLDRIRSRVEFSLAPADPQPVPQLEL